MMIVSDGRYAMPQPCERTDRIIDFITQGFSGHSQLIAASAAMIAKCFPGAIFRPSGMHDDALMAGVLDRVEATNALITIASALPEGAETVDLGRGEISFRISRREMQGVVLRNADAVSRRLTPEKVAVLVNGLTDKGAHYCVMGARPETEVIPSAIERAVAALGPDFRSGEMDLCIISNDGGQIEVMDVFMSLSLEPENAPEMAI